MTGEVEEDDFLLTSLLTFLCFTNGGSDSMAALWSRDDTLCTGEDHTCLEGLELWDIHTVHISILDELTDNHTCTMVAQSACVDVAGLEVMTEGVHRQQWGIASLVTKVIAELTAGEFRATVRLCCDKLSMTLPTQVVTHEGEGDTTEV